MKKRVLIVDDDADTRVLLAAVLAEFDVEVAEAESDQEAYQRYLEFGPDLVLLDVLLPRQGGLALLEKIRSVRGGKDVPVLVMSAVYRGTDVRTQAVEKLGALDFLKKPFQMDLLRSRLRSVLAEPRAAEEPLSSAFNPAEILTRGSLTAVDFPILLKDLAFHKTTGRLNLRQGSMKKVVYLQDGEVTFALSNQVRETLGRHLLARGQIDEDAYRRGLEAMRRDGKKMGEFLLQAGILEPSAVSEAVRANVGEKVLDLFAWEAGDFLVTPYADPPAAMPGAPLESLRLLWDGVRSRLPYGRLSASLAPHEDLVVAPGGDLYGMAADVPLEKADIQFLRVANRMKGQPLSKLLAEVRGEAELRFLYFLLLRGFLRLANADGEVALGPGRDPADLERIRRARKQLEALRARNYFQVLEVPLAVNDEKVREAYLRKAKEVHPDMLGPQDPSELRRLHGETFQIVQAAYESLKTDARRSDYLRFIQRGLTEDVSEGKQILEAETFFVEGNSHMKRRAWDAAAASFRKALELKPEEGDYVLGLGVARCQQAAAGREGASVEAEELLRKALTLLPANPEPLYRLGRLAALKGQQDQAAACYQAALARNPNHLDSQRELRLIRARTEKKGVLGGLLGRKEKR